MKRMAFFLMLLALACRKEGQQPTAAQEPGAAAVKGPSIVCEQPVWEFGTVTDGELVKHTFTLKNVGTEPLTIESARGTCGCTATLVSNKEVPPGGEAKVEVTVNTTGRQGPLQQSVFVSSNDPKNPKLTLTVKGQVEVIAGFKPRHLNLGRMLKGTKRVEVVGIQAKEPEKLVLSDISSSDPRVKARIVQTDKGLPNVEVTVEAGEKEGPLSATVTAKTNLEKPREIVLGVSALVSGDLAVEPPRLFFKDFAQHGSQQMELKVTSLSGKPFRVLGVQEEQGAIIGHANRQGQDWVVAVTLARKPEKSEGIIRIRTDRSDQPMLEVPYRVGGQPAFRSAIPARRAIPEAVRKLGEAMQPQAK